MKTIKSKSELRNLVTQIIKEDMWNDMQKTLKGQQQGTTLNMAKNYQQGQQQGAAAGQATKQAVVAGVNELSRIGKEVIVTIAGTTFKIVTIGVGAAAYTIWAIGSGLWKISTATSNALLKLFTSVKSASIGAATVMSTATINLFKAAGIAINQGAQAFMNGVKALADKGAAVIKWVIGLGVKLGSKVYATILAGANKISEISSAVGSWLGQQWSTIQKNVGIGWEQAKQLGANVASSIGKGVQSGYNTVANAGKSALNYGSKLAGNVTGFVQGLFEMFERFYNFKSDDISGIIIEARYINKGILI